MEYWIWLSRIEGLGPVKIKQLLEKYKTPEKIWELSKEELIKNNRNRRNYSKSNIRFKI